MKKKQQLYLVFGGILKKIGEEDFSNIKKLEYVGIYESLNQAEKAWKSKSIKNIDFANKKFKVIPLYSLIDPTEKVLNYLKRLKLKKISIDSLSFNTDNTLLDASKKFQEYNAGAGVVMNKNKLSGIVTERDIIKTVAANKKNFLETKLKYIMTKKVVYINTNFTLMNALEVLKSSGFRHLPIYDNKKLKYYGIISYKDFMLGNLN
ncbi:MAG: DUF4170 domain-containing protein [Pseudomonadota bacterium]|nr:DUF4170 domain-containing protein [Pseudomonadota bacterium]